MINRHAHTLTFTGDYKTLKPNGFTYRRLFARNAICYEKQDVWIWRAGRGVDLLDLYGHSGALLAYLRAHDFAYVSKTRNGFDNPRLTLDRETGRVLPYATHYHEDVSVWTGQAHPDYNPERYRVIHNLTEAFIATLRTLDETGQLELTEIPYADELNPPQ